MTLQVKTRIHLLVGILVAAILLLTVWAAVAPGPARAATVSLNGLTCTKTDKSNGGFVLDCDPMGGTPSTGPSSASPSSTLTASPSVSPSPSTSTTTASPSTSPSTTPPPPPPPPPSTGPNCLANPQACGFPGPDNTGANGSLLTVNGNQTFTQANQLVTNRRFTGCVEVRASNVTFRNVVFAAPCFAPVRVFSGYATIEDAEISCAKTAGSSGFISLFSAGIRSTLRRVEIHDCENGLSAQGNVTLVDSWIHTLCCSGHSDGAQVDQAAGWWTFQHNTIDNRGDTTSAIIMWDEDDPQNHDAVIDGNLMAGGAYTLYCPRQNASNITITNNRFAAWSYGPQDSCVPGHVTTWSGNREDATNKIITP